MNAGDTKMLDRRVAVAELLRDRGALLLVTGLGSPTYDAASVCDSDANFYLWGAMGSAVTVGLGLALAQPDCPILVLTGDGELLMGLGAVSTVGAKRPKNLSIAVLDNQCYGETGMQKTHTFQGVSLSGVADACRFARAEMIETFDQVTGFRSLVQSMVRGPNFAQIRVKPENLKKVLPTRDGVHLKNRFRKSLGVSSN